ncbi:GNAT family N-acetyltransferase [Ancylobacter oerskovii]|uniref:GNAT family N-acetyltransferase n=1 Tax=Ancylobacter oerskovii TaxID=459519 RepID=A0ABW4YSE0_9HYPH|nr:GNAT family protein [Ancylobacter oerskovii]MBS7545356.1 GNAT family N-acetyltransferase [Ancylobacter oerskovii]
MAGEAPAVPELETARLSLRALGPADAEGLHQAYGDAEAMRFWDLPASADVAETERRIRFSLQIGTAWHAAWAVRTRTDGRADGRFVGMVNYHDRQPWNRRLAVGWILVPALRGQGLMTEAMGALLAHGFGALDAHRIEAEIEPQNLPSERLARRLGFRREGLLRDRLQVAGRARSVAMWSLLRPEWEAGRVSS